MHTGDHPTHPLVAIIPDKDMFSERRVTIAASIMISIPLLAEIDSCEYLFLRETGESDPQVFRLLVEEACASPESVTMNIGGTELTDCHPVKGTARFFEIVWNSYIAYCVRNESYCSPEKEAEIAIGNKRFRVYSKSYFTDYISNATFATSEYPGPVLHYCVATENHVVDVASMEQPQIRNLRLADS